MPSDGPQQSPSSLWDSEPWPSCSATHPPANRAGEKTPAPRAELRGRGGRSTPLAKELRDKGKNKKVCERADPTLAWSSDGRIYGGARGHTQVFPRKGRQSERAGGGGGEIWRRRTKTGGKGSKVKMWRDSSKGNQRYRGERRGRKQYKSLYSGGVCLFLGEM